MSDANDTPGSTAGGGGKTYQNLSSAYQQEQEGEAAEQQQQGGQAAAGYQQQGGQAAAGYQQQGGMAAEYQQQGGTAAGFQQQGGMAAGFQQRGGTAAAAGYQQSGAAAGYQKQGGSGSGSRFQAVGTSSSRTKISGGTVKYKETTRHLRTPNSARGLAPPPPPPPPALIHKQTHQALLRRPVSYPEGFTNSGHDAVEKAVGDLVQGNHALKTELERLKKLLAECSSNNQDYETVLNDLLQRCQEYAAEYKLCHPDNLSLPDLPGFVVHLITVLSRMNESCEQQATELFEKTTEYERDFETRRQNTQYQISQLQDELKLLQERLTQAKKEAELARQQKEAAAKQLNEAKNFLVEDHVANKAELEKMQGYIDNQLRPELEKAVSDATLVSENAQKVVDKMNKDIREKEVELETLHKRRLGSNGQLEALQKELTTLRGSLDQAKVERRVLVNTVQRELDQILTDRLGIERSFPTQEYIPKNLETIFKSFQEEFDKAKEASTKLAADNQRLRKEIEETKSKPRETRSTYEVRIREEYGTYARNMKSEADKALAMVKQLQKELDDLKRERRGLEKGKRQGKEKYEQVIDEYKISYNSELRSWQTLQEEFEGQIKVLRAEVNGHLTEVDKLEKRAEETGKALAQKETDIRDLTAQTEESCGPLRAELDKMEKEAAQLRQRWEMTYQEGCKTRAILQDQVNNAMAELEAARDSRKILTEKLKRIKKKKTERQLSLENHEKRFRELEALLKEFNNNCQKISADNQQVQSRNEGIRAQLEIDRQVITDLRKDIHHVEQEIRNSHGDSPSDYSEASPKIQAEHQALVIQQRTYPNQVKSLEAEIGVARDRDNDVSCRLDAQDRKNTNLKRERDALQAQLRMLKENNERVKKEKEVVVKEWKEKRRKIVEQQQKQAANDRRFIVETLDRSPSARRPGPGQENCEYYAKYVTTTGTGGRQLKVGGWQTDEELNEIIQRRKSRQRQGVDGSSADDDDYYATTELLEAVKAAERDIQRTKELIRDIITLSGGTLMNDSEKDIQEVYLRLGQLRRKMERLYQSEHQTETKAQLEWIKAEATALSESIKKLITKPASPKTMGLQRSIESPGSTASSRAPSGSGPPASGPPDSSGPPGSGTSRQ